MDLQPLKPKQIDAIKSFESGKDTFVSLPTGYGKSIIFAVLPLLFDYMHGITGSIAVVVTPLISLMLDQKNKFLQKGIKVEFVGEAQEDEKAFESVMNGQVQLVYISPENLLENRRYRNMLQCKVYQEKMIALVVDEAHCVKFWGNEFRTAFAKIGNVRSLLPSHVNILDLTVTATKGTLDCVISRLALQDPVIIGLPPDRPNIKLLVEPCPTIPELCFKLAEELKEKRHLMPKTVIFCRSLSHCADMCTMMKRLLGSKITEPPGLPSMLRFRLIDIFTAASNVSMREEVLKEFCKTDTKLRLLIATTAFGLGVDIERVINYGTPSTLEELVQESRRAGRDGREACSMLYHKTVKRITPVVKMYGENQSVCRRTLLFKNFIFSDIGSASPKACKCCDLCMLLCNCSICKDF